MGDINGDGVSDIALGTTDGLVLLYYGATGPTWALAGQIDTGTATQVAAVGVYDVTDDGLADLILVHYDGFSSVWENQGGTAFSQIERSAGNAFYVGYVRSMLNARR